MSDKIYFRLQKALVERPAEQREIAEKCGYSQGQVSSILNGNVPINMRFIKAFCKEFGFSEVWLLTGEGEMRQAVLSDAIRAALTDSQFSALTEDEKMKLIMDMLQRVPTG